MTATRTDITDWYRQGEKMGATHMIVAVDRYDHENYPVYIMPGESATEKRDEILNGGNMQGIDECYSFALSFDDQMAERRAHHYD